MYSYAVTLFKDIGVTTNPYIPAIATGMIRLVGTLVSTAPQSISSEYHYTAADNIPYRSRLLRVLTMTRSWDRNDTGWTLIYTGVQVGTGLVKRFGRKPLMATSALLMAVFMAILAATVHFKEKHQVDMGCVWYFTKLHCPRPACPALA